MFQGVEPLFISVKLLSSSPLSPASQGTNLCPSVHDFPSIPHQVSANKSHLWVEEEVWRMEIYLSLGVLALGTLSLLAVTSLPSIANSLNWREFTFVQVK